MNYEQKYKEALENFKIIKNANRDNKELVYFIECEYPELKESEDEMIRKEIIKLVHYFYGSSSVYEHHVSEDDMIAWLEKQGEQPSWSDYDERIKRCIQVALTDVYEKRFNDYDTTLKDCLAWLKSLKDRVQPHPKQEWSEEDEKLYISALWHIKNSCGNGGKDSGEYEVYNWLQSLKDRVQQKQEWNEEDIEIIKMIEDCLSFYKMTHCVTLPSVETCIEWLKSLKPQNHWKPSEEQMRVLQIAIRDYGVSHEKSIFESLYNDLKNL